MSKKGNSHRVVSNPKGGWDGKRASIHANAKQEVSKLTREISQNQKTELVIHNKDGKIASKDSHGNNPRNING